MMGVLSVEYPTLVCPEPQSRMIGSKFSSILCVCVCVLFVLLLLLLLLLLDNKNNNNNNNKTNNKNRTFTSYRIPEITPATKMDDVNEKKMGRFKLV